MQGNLIKDDRQSIVQLPERVFSQFQQLCLFHRKVAISGLRTIVDYDRFIADGSHEINEPLSSLHLILANFLGVKLTFTGNPRLGTLRLNRIAPCTDACFHDGPPSPGGGSRHSFGAQEATLIDTDQLSPDAVKAPAYLWVMFGREYDEWVEHKVLLTLVGNDPICDSGLVVGLDDRDERAQRTLFAISEVLVAHCGKDVANLYDAGAARLKAVNDNWGAARLR